MGNQLHSSEQFNTRDWVQVSQVSNLVTLWQNKNNSNVHLEEHKIYTLDAKEMNEELDLYYRRKNHSRWVAALFFREKSTEQFCVSRSVAHIYLEKIPIRISDLRDLPNTDAIHTYDQCLQGFAELASLYGHFRVHPQFIGVNEKGVVKVWAGEQWAQVSIIANKISQEEMVASIISAIDGSLTQDNTVYQDNSIRNYLYRKADTLTFHQATRQLREYANVTNGGMLPTRLESLYQNKNFDQFMQPLLRLTHDDQYQSKIHPSNYIANNQPPIENPLTSFKKVESSQERRQMREEVSMMNSTLNHKLHEEIGRRPATSFREDKKMEVVGKEPSLISSHHYNQRSHVNISAGQSRINGKASSVGKEHYQVRGGPGAVQAGLLQPPQTYQGGVHVNQGNYQQRVQGHKVQASPQLMSAPQPAGINFKYQQQPPNRGILQRQPPSRGILQPPVQNSTSLNKQPPRQPLPPLNLSRPAAAGKINFQSHQQNQTQPSSLPTYMKQPSQGPPPPSHPHPPIPMPQQPLVQPERHKAMPESIIMQLYKEDNSDVPTKQFGRVKRTQSIRQQKGIETSTLIKGTGSNPMLGTPNNYHQGTPSQLQSIQELNSEHYRQNQALGLSHQRLDSDLAPSISSRTNQYATLDPNDGKSSQEMIQFLRSYSPQPH